MYLKKKVPLLFVFAMMSSEVNPVCSTGDCSAEHEASALSTASEIISYKESLEKLNDFKHGSHAMLYARDPSLLFNEYPMKAAVMMQMRFDGLLGFPGGFVDEGENPVEGLNRELEEEIAMDLSKLSLTEKNHCRSFVDRGKKLILHFFVKKISLSEFLDIEKAAIRSPDHGGEVLGLIRAPLYTMADGLLGLPAFLAQNFAGNARDEFICGIKRTGLFEEEYIEKALSVAENFRRTKIQNS